MFVRTKQIILAVAMMTAGAVGITPTAEAASSPSLSCAATPAAGIPVNVVLVGTTGNGSSDFQARLDAFDTVAASAYKTGSDLVVAVAGASISQDHIVLAVHATGVGVNDRYADSDEQCAVNQVVSTFRSARSGQTSGTIDVLGALEATSADLRSLRPSHVSVLIMSSGLQGAQPLDLAGEPTLLAVPQLDARTLAAQGVLPHLRGWSIAFLNDGVATDQQAQALAALWWRVIAAAGGHLTSYSNAVLAWPLSPMPEPKVPNYQPPNPPQHIPIDVPNDTLFAINSATLSSGGIQVMAEVANLMTKVYPGSTATVSCYADSATGTPEYNLQLSRARCASVSHALGADGVPSTKLSEEGIGGTNQWGSDPAENRRVEIVVYPNAGPS